MRDATILLVEDDEIDARAVQRGLAQARLSNPVVVATDGVQALRVLRGADGNPPLRKPYLILLDLNMPRMNGFEFLEEIRRDAFLKEAPVFVLTTSNDEQDRVRAAQNNVAGYLLKSREGSDFRKFVEMLRELDGVQAEDA